MSPDLAATTFFFSGMIQTPAVFIIPGIRKQPDLPKPGLPEESGRFFGGRRVDVKPSTPFETGNFSQLWNNFHVPMVMRKRTILNRRAVDDVVIRRPLQHLIDFTD